MSPGLSLASSAPTLLGAVNASLVAYAAALASLPGTPPNSSPTPAWMGALQASATAIASRHVRPCSPPLTLTPPCHVIPAQAAQAQLSLSAWAASLGQTAAGLRAVAAAAQSAAFTQSAASLPPFAAAANASLAPSLQPLRPLLDRLDGAYLPQQATPSALAQSGGGCVARLAATLRSFDDAAFALRPGSDGRVALGAALSVQSALAGLYPVSGGLVWLAALLCRELARETGHGRLATSLAPQGQA